MKKTSETAREAFQKNIAEAREALKKIESQLNEEYFGCFGELCKAPGSDKINWAHVGTAEHVNRRLQEIVHTITTGGNTRRR